ncbi:MAG: hypothetical protein N3D20_02615, partial [Candidatus Pacearchaeota archaeon]|nr:hypothetical protein [Candidatus Pacearchaeota archaeon]
GFGGPTSTTTSTTPPTTTIGNIITDIQNKNGIIFNDGGFVLGNINSATPTSSCIEFYSRGIGDKSKDCKSLCSEKYSGGVCLNAFDKATGKKIGCDNNQDNGVVCSCAAAVVCNNMNKTAVGIPFFTTTISEGFGGTILYENSALTTQSSGEYKITCNDICVTDNYVDKFNGFLRGACLGAWEDNSRTYRGCNDGVLTKNNVCLCAAYISGITNLTTNLKRYQNVLYSRSIGVKSGDGNYLTGFSGAVITSISSTDLNHGCSNFANRIFGYLNATCSEAKGVKATGGSVDCTSNIDSNSPNYGGLCVNIAY